MSKYLKELIEDESAPIHIDSGEISLDVSEFNVVHHHTFFEVEALVNGTEDGNDVNGTYVYAVSGDKPRTEYYGSGDAGGAEDSPVFKAIDENPDVRARIEEIVSTEDQGGLTSTDDGLDVSSVEDETPSENHSFVTSDDLFSNRES